MTRESVRFASPCRRRPTFFSPFRTAIVQVGFVLLLSLIFGCGTGDYERRLNERNAKLQAQAASKFNVLAGLQELPGTGVSINMPRSFADAPLAEGAADARRVKPGIVTIPGLKLTREGFIVDADGGQIPFYCYVGVTPGPMQNVITQVQNELNGMPGKPSEWTDFQGEAPNGSTVAWRKMRFEGDQEFYYKNKNGQEQFFRQPGVLEVYVHDAGAQVVLVIWRMPASIEPNVGLARLAPLVAGSVIVNK